MEHEDIYQLLRNRLRKWAATKKGRTNKWAEYLMLAPDLFHVLVKLAIDSRISSADKTKLVTAVAYFMSPLDTIPEGIVGPVGYVDDIAIAAVVINAIVNSTDPKVVRDHWAGDRDVLEVIQEILAIADAMIGAGLWVKTKSVFRKPDSKPDRT